MVHVKIKTAPDNWYLKRIIGLNSKFSFNAFSVDKLSRTQQNRT